MENKDKLRKLATKKALEWYLSEFPEFSDPEEVLEHFELLVASDDIVIWSKFEFDTPEAVAERISEMVTVNLDAYEEVLGIYGVTI
jgi:hypothetical protein